MSDKKIRPKTDHERHLIAAKYAYVAGLIEHDGATPEDLRVQRSELKAEFDLLIKEVRASAWGEAIDACAQQGTIQEPDNPYLESR